ncbi:MAG: ATP-binding protein, partial [Clostridia bacterium]|nr:ATP-binding protein [Clostridia bacterium]
TTENSNEKIISGVKNSLKEFVGENETFDDATLMIVDVGEAKLEAEFVKPDYGIIEQVTDIFNKEFSFVDKEILGLLDVVIDEMLNNIISYEKTDNLVLGFDAKLKDDSIVMRFIGNGEKFDPLSVKDKYIFEGQKDIIAGGFGITITKSVTDGVSYQRKNGKNILTVIKKINATKA